MQSLAAALRHATILRQPSLLNISKRMAWRWVEEPTDDNATGPEQRQQFKSRDILAINRQQLDKKDSIWSTTMNSSKIGEALRGEYRAQVDAVKTDHNGLLAKLNSLQAGNEGLHVRMETMEQKLKLVDDLETKLVKQQEMLSSIAEKVSEANLLEAKENYELVREKQDEANWSENNKAKKNYSIEVDGKNHWNAEHCGQMSFTMNHLSVTNKMNDDTKFASVRSMKPFSLVASNLTRVFYFEVLVKLGHLDIGLSGPDFPVENNKFCVGKYPGSYSYCAVGRVFAANIVPTPGYEKIVVGDTVGCGLVQVAADKLKIFFTKNGLFNGKPLLLPFALDEQKLFYPTVTLQYQGTTVEANFGADPFKYNFAGLEAVIDV